MLKKLGAFGFLVVLILSLTLSGCFSFSVPDPSFTVEGVEDGQTYEQPVTPTIEPGKGTTLTITLNGEPFESGTTITQDGEYKLVIVAKNSRGKETTSEIKFTIELDVPLITITGVEDGGYYWDAVTPNITTDGENDTIVVTLNGEEYTLGTPIEAHDKYTMVITATNEKGKSWTVTIEFEIGAPPEHEIGIGQELAGFQPASDSVVLSYNTDPQYIKSGNGSLKVEKDGNSGHGPRLNRKGDHPDWIDDWSRFDKLTVWFYVENVDSLADNALTFRMYSEPQKDFGIAKSSLTDGWNLLEIDLKALVGSDTDILKDMSSIFIEFIIRTSGGKETFYMDEFKLTMSDLADQ